MRDDRSSSLLLEEALRQVDRLIMQGESCDVTQLARSLRSTLESSEAITELPDVETIQFLARWTNKFLKNIEMGMEGGCEGCEDMQQHRMRTLETEREQLSMQVNILTDQVEAQNDKISELENSLSRSQEQLNNSENLLKKEMSLRTSLEGGRLDLVSQVSSLRLRLSQVEIEKRDLEERNVKLENELILTCACLAEKEADLVTIKSKLARNGAISPKFDSGSEMDKLRGALSSVISVNDEKEKTIQEMQTSLNRYKKLNELVLSNPSRRNVESGLPKCNLDDSFHSVTLDNITSSDTEDFVTLSSGLSDKPPPVPRQTEDSRRPASRQENRLSPIFGPSPPPTPQKTPPSRRHYSTLPRPHHADILKQHTITPISISTGASHSFHNLHHPNFETNPRRPKATSGSSFGKGFFRLRLGRRSCSAPDLAPEHLDVVSPMGKTDRRTSSPLPPHKVKGFKRIFGKVKRSGSESLPSPAADLKRGGMRATAGPRLGWSQDLQSKRSSFKVDLPFCQWNGEILGDWFQIIGLGSYSCHARKWLRNGEQLLKSTMSDFEKELHMKSPLHRKKLLLAAVGRKEVRDGPGFLDSDWVVRWLDDIGLPLYKTAFQDGLLDGRMLHHLTLEDLGHLKVSNLLHVLSIKTGIRVLRENHFQPHCLLRRPLSDDGSVKEEVSCWSNHRVMEWLRSVDLSEYAPNLRGSGVHGGLMLYENGFNSDLLASLLNIPANKTLLRRHLTTQFRQLIGSEVLQKKRDWEARSTPLSPSAKMKPAKKSSFSLVKKKGRIDMEPDDYVCPMSSTDQLLDGSTLLNCTEEEKFLMKEMVLKSEPIGESVPSSNV